MIRKFIGLLAASALTLTAMAPVTAASAHERRNGDYGYDCRNDGIRDSCRRYRDYDDCRRDGIPDSCRYDRRYGYYRHDRDDDDGDAVAAGVIGLVLGLAIGAASEQNQRRYDDGYDRRYDDSGLEGGYDGYYEPRRPQCTRRERQWDRYARRYVYVDVPC